MFGNIPRMFNNIPQNVWRDSLEYNIPPISSVPRIQFPVSVFLVLDIALTELKTNVNLKQIKLPTQSCSL